MRSKKLLRQLCMTEAVRQRLMLFKSLTPMQNRLLKVRSPLPDRVIQLPVMYRQQGPAVLRPHVARYVFRTKQVTSLVAKDTNRPGEVDGGIVSGLVREMVIAPGRWATTTNQEVKGPRAVAGWTSRQGGPRFPLVLQMLRHSEVVVGFVESGVVIHACIVMMLCCHRLRWLCIVRSVECSVVILLVTKAMLVRQLLLLRARR